MNIFRDLKDLPTFKNSVITIGTYDGVHLGHQKIIKRINRLAEQVEGESIIVTFHPHPRTIVNDNFRVDLLSPLDEKFDLLEKYGVQNVVVVPFNRSFSEQSPDDYIRNFLYKSFVPNTIVIGYDHKFGKDRAGDINMLRQASTELNFKVEEISKQELEDLAISSTKIRTAVNEGNVSLANQLLGHPYILRGVVVKGEQLGRQIGFPTANIQIQDQDKLVPSNGVYAVRVKVLENNYNGMLNIGIRPTVSGKYRTIEVNLFDFDENIYGEVLEVELVERIRAEQKFSGIKSLVEQLTKDKQTTVEILEKV